MREMRYAYKVLIGRHRWPNDIETSVTGLVKKTGYKDGTVASSCEHDGDPSYSTRG
jgi:hypothetical protein